MKKISIVTPTYNEEDNIQLICDNIKNEFIPPLGGDRMAAAPAG